MKEGSIIDLILNTIEKHFGSNFVKDSNTRFIIFHIYANNTKINCKRF